MGKKKKLTLTEIVMKEIARAVTTGEIVSVKSIRNLITDKKEVKDLNVTRPQLTFEIFKTILTDQHFHLVSNDQDEDFIARVS